MESLYGLLNQYYEIQNQGAREKYSVAYDIKEFLKKDGYSAESARTLMNFFGKNPELLTNDDNMKRIFAKTFQSQSLVVVSELAKSRIPEKIIDVIETYYVDMLWDLPATQLSAVLERYNEVAKNNPTLENSSLHLAMTASFYTLKQAMNQEEFKDLENSTEDNFEDNFHICYDMVNFCNDCAFKHTLAETLNNTMKNIVAKGTIKDIGDYSYKAHKLYEQTTAMLEARSEQRYQEYKTKLNNILGIYERSSMLEY